ncbi:MAG: ADOP family duplicated permease [Gemmatimonadaceae bacterium]
MPALAHVRALWRALFRRADAERELDDELRAYVELLAAEKVRAGMDPAAARRSALLETGGVDQVKEAVRDARPGHGVETVLGDLRYAVRTTRRAPAFALLVVLALGLGVGATTAIFSVVDAVLLRPLPYQEPARIVAVMHDVTMPAAPANFLDWKREVRAIDAMGAAQASTATISGDGPAERIIGLRVTSELLPMTGVRPALGRLFGTEAEQPGRDREVVLSWGFWQRRFAGDRAVIGRSVTLDGQAHTIVGVMPAGFDFPSFWVTGVQVWRPLALGANASSREIQTLRVFGRLAAGATLAQARAEVATVAARLERAFPGTNRKVTVTPLEEIVVGGVRRTLLVLLAAVGLVLLVACANVAHMLLARGAARRRELTVRAALGASRGRIVGQLLTESVVLAAAGGLLGVALAAAGVRGLAALGAGTVPRLELVSVDGRVLLFAALVSVATGVLFGLAPALRAARDDLASAMRDARGSTGGAREARVRSVLVASEFALALVLLAGAGLAIRSFERLRAVDPGLDPRGVLSAEVSVYGTGAAAPERRAAFYDELLARARRIPGVQSASLVNHVPLAGDEWRLSYAVEGRPLPEQGAWPAATYRVSFPGYLGTVGARLLRGRDVGEGDREDAPGVAVVNETFARRTWPGEDAIGKRIVIGDPREGAPWLTVVGVVHDVVRSRWTDEPHEEVYVPWRQAPMYRTSDGGHVGYMTLVLRLACAREARCDAASVAPAVREAVASLDRSVPVSAVQTMDAAVADANARPRFTLFLLACFAGVALALAAVGIYGVMSYAVAQRTREIGVRLALGAAPHTVLRLVVAQGMGVALAGIVAGVLGALVLTRLMAGMLYGVAPTDPATFALVPLVLGLVALVATLVPALRATRIDPLLALRGE